MQYKIAEIVAKKETQPNKEESNKEKTDKEEKSDSNQQEAGNKKSDSEDNMYMYLERPPKGQKCYRYVSKTH